MSSAERQEGRAERCPHCGTSLQMVHVHGHGQCAHCGTNVDPCCSGADAQSEVDPSPGASTQVDPQVFVRLFRQLGGEDATVTAASAVLALARMLDAPLDEARVVIDAGIELGHLQAEAATLRLGRGD